MPFSSGLVMLLMLLAMKASPAPEPKTEVDFTKDIRPILERCQPCHFPGGVMYAKLPFDQPATVDKLGEKLFSRIKDEKQRELIRRFIATRTRPRSPAPEAAPSTY